MASGDGCCEDGVGTRGTVLSAAGDSSLQRRVIVGALGQWAKEGCIGDGELAVDTMELLLTI